jgi:hypothetical protein
VSTIRHMALMVPAEEEPAAPVPGSGQAHRQAVARALLRAELTEREDEELVLAALALMD